MKKVQNKNDKGNPYHAEDGTFTSPDGASGSSEIESEGFVVKPFDPDNIDDFLASFEDFDEKAKQLIVDSQKFNAILNLKAASQVSIEDNKKFLENSANEYDKNKLESLTENEINALIIAEKANVATMVAQQHLDLVKISKDELEKKIRKEIVEELNHEIDITNLDFSGLWISYPSIENYEEYSKKDESGTSRIDRKREYFENLKQKYLEQIKHYSEVIDDVFAFDDEVEKAQEEIKKCNSVIASAENSLKKLDNFVSAGEKYLQIKIGVNAKYLPQLETIESDIVSSQKSLDQLNTPEFAQFVIQSKELIGTYQDEKAIYSQFRKDNAVWFKDDDSYKQAKKYFSPIAAKHFEAMNSDEKESIEDYTQSYHKFNEPLRHLSYTGGKSFLGGQTFSQAVSNLTNAIDKCTWENDIWVQRGIDSNVECFLLPGENVPQSISQMTEKQRQSLIGQSFVDNGFTSAGAGKETGFIKNLILNIYCPKGTKMAYAEYVSYFEGENEMILQRGYTYRITKVEKKGFQFFIDCEVILNSDKNKPIGQELENLGKKYYKG